MNTTQENLKFEKRLHLSIGINFEADKDRFDLVDWDLYHLSSLFIKDFEKSGHFKSIKYYNEHADVRMTLTIKALYDINGLFYNFLSGLSLGIIPLYRKHEYQLFVKVEGKCVAESNFDFPIKIRHIYNLYTYDFRPDIAHEDVSEKIVKKILELYLEKNPKCAI
ncbi:hypothetical protein [Leptospira bouyouniensis]|uniref:AraC family transcriptional regulator n=1 Tax=Leptospira bouyouniensis TaxID=2484911 RepID=A0ABY2LDK2_9LEPT|nr:hypothetical protein [Leptospira bouyouniensis]TGK54241.1 hypothetical protein EHQ10_00305 [Leptospira bouyouniensis]